MFRGASMNTKMYDLNAWKVIFSASQSEMVREFVAMFEEVKD
jgi:hypothetical protein